MYRDAKEELKRLEEALLEEDSQPEADNASQWDIDIDEAVSDIPDLPQTDHKDRVIRRLTAAVIILAAAIVGALIFLFVRYGGVFL